jgi:hypothetical protein
MYPSLIGRRLPEAQPNLHQKVGLAFNKSFAAEKKHAVPGDWNPLGSAEQADNRQKMLGKAAGLKSEADP